MKPYISVIIPIYKVEAYLRRCVDSVLNQADERTEIVLVDDGSPDGCPAICDDYARKNPGVKVVHKPNGGLSDARNAGMDAAEGQYLLFLDADDWLNENALETLLTHIARHEGTDLFIGLLKNDDGTLYSHRSAAEIGKEYRGEEYYNRFSGSIIPCAVAPLYRKAFLLEHQLRFMVGKYHEDNDFTPRVYYHAEKVVYTGCEFYVRFVRNDSITTRPDKRRNLMDMQDVLKSVYDFTSTIPNQETVRNIRQKTVGAYLSLFYVADIYQYKGMDYKAYYDKKLVLDCSYSGKSRLKALIFALSPRLYMLVHKLAG